MSILLTSNADPSLEAVTWRERLAQTKNVSEEFGFVLVFSFDAIITFFVAEIRSSWFTRIVVVIVMNKLVHLSDVNGNIFPRGNSPLSRCAAWHEMN